MAINVQYQPAAGVIGPYALAAGLGQFAERQQQRNDQVGLSLARMGQQERQFQQQMRSNAQSRQQQRADNWNRASLGALADVVQQRQQLAAQSQREAAARDFTRLRDATAHRRELELLDRRAELAADAEFDRMYPLSPTGRGLKESFDNERRSAARYHESGDMSPQQYAMVMDDIARREQAANLDQYRKKKPPEPGDVKIEDGLEWTRDRSYRWRPTRLLDKEARDQRFAVHDSRGRRMGWWSPDGTSFIDDPEYQSILDRETEQRNAQPPEPEIDPAKRHKEVMDYAKQRADAGLPRLPLPALADRLDRERRIAAGMATPDELSLNELESELDDITPQIADAQQSAQDAAATGNDAAASQNAARAQGLQARAAEITAEMQSLHEQIQRRQQQVAEPPVAEPVAQPEQSVLDATDWTNLPGMEAVSPQTQPMPSMPGASAPVSGPQPTGPSPFAGSEQQDEELLSYLTPQERATLDDLERRRRTGTVNSFDQNQQYKELYAEARRRRSEAQALQRPAAAPPAIQAEQQRIAASNAPPAERESQMYALARAAGKQKVLQQYAKAGVPATIPPHIEAMAREQAAAFSETMSPENRQAAIDAQLLGILEAAAPGKPRVAVPPEMFAMHLRAAEQHKGAPLTPDEQAEIADFLSRSPQAVKDFERDRHFAEAAPLQQAAASFDDEKTRNALQTLAELRRKGFKPNDKNAPAADRKRYEQAKAVLEQVAKKGNR